MKNKKILELCLSPELGGLELYVSSCYKFFSAKTICKIVVAPGQKLDTYLGNEDQIYVSRNKFFPIIPALKLSKYVDENDIDVIHFHWTRDMITAVLAKVLSKKKPKLIQSRHMGMTRFKDDIYHRWAYKNIDTIHAVTLKVQEQLKKFIPADICPVLEMVYPGTTISDFNENILNDLQCKYKSKNEFIVGIVGRIEDAKGQYLLIEAMKELEGLNIKCLIVGSAMDEVYLDKLKQKVKDLRLEERVVFTGFTKNVSEYMQLFDINILATENETFGLVVIEAMANKVPMVATNNGGPLEIIDDGIDGLLFNGSAKDLASKIKLLYKNKELVNSISESGFKKVQEKFASDVQLEKLYKIIN